MYLYMLPFSTALDPAIAAAESEAQIPTPDGSETMTARFDDPGKWLARHRRDKTILFPPQAFLLEMVGQFITSHSSSSSPAAKEAHYGAQRDKIRAFLDKVPTAATPNGAKHPTAQIPWADKCISPVTLGLREDGRAILSLEKPGPELEGSGRGGVWETVVLVKFGPGGPAQVELRDREEVLRELREAKEKEKEKGSKL